MNKDTKNMVICGDDNIICASIQDSLPVEGEWHVVHVQTTQQLDELMQGEAINQITVIIIVHQESQFDLSSNYLRLLQEHSQVKLVAISLANNIMEVYCKQNVLIRHASDFINAIQAIPD